MATHTHLSTTTEVLPLSLDIPVDDLWIYCILPLLPVGDVIRMYGLSRRWRDVALSGIVTLDDRNLVYLPSSRLPNLRELGMMRFVPPETCMHMGGLRTLCVSLMEPAHMPSLALLTNLEHLSISSRNDLHLDIVTKLTKLLHLRIPGLPVGLGALPRLRELRLTLKGSLDASTHDTLSTLTGLFTLTLDRLHGVDLSASIEDFTMLTNLKCLRFGKVRITGDAKRLYLPALRSIRWPPGMTVTADHIRATPNITALFMGNKAAEVVRDESGTYILKKLACLRVPGVAWRVAEDDCISGMTSLERLDVGSIFGPTLGEDVSSPMAHLTNLRELNVSRSLAPANQNLLRYLPDTLEKITFGCGDTVLSGTQWKQLAQAHRACNALKTDATTRTALSILLTDVQYLQ